MKFYTFDYHKFCPVLHTDPTFLHDRVRNVWPFNTKIPKKVEKWIPQGLYFFFFRYIFITTYYFNVYIKLE